MSMPRGGSCRPSLDEERASEWRRVMQQLQPHGATQHPPAPQTLRGAMLPPPPQRVLGEGAALRAAAQSRQVQVVLAARGDEPPRVMSHGVLAGFEGAGAAPPPAVLESDALQDMLQQVGNDTVSITRDHTR